MSALLDAARAALHYVDDWRDHDGRGEAAESLRAAIAEAEAAEQAAPRRIRDTGAGARRVDVAKIAAALGAEPMDAASAARYRRIREAAVPGGAPPPEQAPEVCGSCGHPPRSGRCIVGLGGTCRCTWQPPKPIHEEEPQPMEPEDWAELLAGHAVVDGSGADATVRLAEPAPPGPRGTCLLAVVDVAAVHDQHRHPDRTECVVLVDDGSPDGMTEVARCPTFEDGDAFKELLLEVIGRLRP